MVEVDSKATALPFVRSAGSKAVTDSAGDLQVIFPRSLSRMVSIMARDHKTVEIPMHDW